MRNRGLVVAVVVANLSCFSTALYDREHAQRVSTINARYDAALALERTQYESLVDQLDQRRAFVILDSLRVFSHDRSRLTELDQQAASLAQRHATARSRLEQQRRRELGASLQQRDREISAGRAARRARVKAAADAFDAEERGQPRPSTVDSPPSVLR